MSKRISLAEAIGRCRREDGLHVRSCESYRKDAKERGSIWIGLTKLVCAKTGRQWTVDADELEAAVGADQIRRKQEQETIQQADDDYEARKLHPGSARTSWGGYSVNGDFHFVWSEYARLRQRSNGHWRCNRCWESASTENERPECHRCRDWSDCGTDCTLSRVYCQPCGTSLPIGQRPR